MRLKCLCLFVLTGMLCLGAWGSEPCGTCHEDIPLGPAGKAHMKVASFEVQGHAVGCEGCHDGGLLEQHMEEGDAQFVVTYGDHSEDGNQACMSCHATLGMGTWDASEHASEGLACTECHTIHSGEAAVSCFTCHEDVAASFRMPSHHPVGPGRMSCESCHDPHAATDDHLKAQTRPNDLCYDCHPTKEGPFIFEHEPVLEDCSLCHSPHGSIANNLLVANEPTLCLQCHEFHFHSNHGGQAAGNVAVGTGTYRNPHGELGLNRAMTTKCTQCHTRIHGSDQPSQTVTGAGRGLMR